MEMKFSTVNSYCQPTSRKKLAFRILTIVTMKTCLEAVPIGKHLGEKVHFFVKQVYFLKIDKIKCTYL